MKPSNPSNEFDNEKRQALLAGAHANNELAGGLIKWTLGSLLVVNGGALVALVGADDLRTEAFKEAALFFGGGMLFALVGGVCWTMAFGFFANDCFKRAFDPRPLTIDDLIKLDADKRTRKWIGAATTSFLFCLGLFGMGCISTAFIPKAVELERLSAESAEAAARSIAASEGVIEIFNDESSTPEQRQIAVDRARAAEIEARIHSARVKRALGKPDGLFDRTISSASTSR